MKLRTILVITLAFVVLSACSKTIGFKAAIVYKMGGAQPVARVPFYLLDEDLRTILGKANLPYSDNKTLVFDYGLATRYRDRNHQRLDQMQAAIAPHIVRSATTDFEGNGRFDNLSKGTYYIVGVAETRGGFAVWNLRVDVANSPDTIMLDQNNADYAS